MTARRGWLVGGMVLALLASGGAVAKSRYDGRCGADDHLVQAVAVPHALLTPAELAARHDTRLARLVRAASSWHGPFGPVVGGVGFDYGQPITLAGLPTGLGVWSRSDPVFGVLSARLAPRWGLQDSRDAHAWDAAGRHFLGIALPAGSSPQLSEYDATTGDRLWCTRLGPALDRDDPLSTSMDDGGGVLVLAGVRGHLRLSSLDADGRTRWSRAESHVDEGDYLGRAPYGFVAGGRPAYELLDVAALGARDSVSGFTPAGRRIWSYRSAAGSATHVLGIVGSTTTVLEVARTSRVLGLDAGGGVAWSTPVPPHADTALRGDVVLVRTPSSLSGIDAGTGRLRWRTRLPRTPQVFPYGFALEQQPMLDADHVLLGETSALVSLDVRTGEAERHPLPTDGIRTTYWPYQVVVTPDLVGLATNTGVVVLRRR